MKKILILLLLPVFIQCSKEPVQPGNSNPTDTTKNPTDTTKNPILEKKCYLNKTIYSSNKSSFVYERDDQNRTVKSIFITDGINSGYNLYYYNGTELVKVENYNKAGEHISHSTLTRTGSDILVSSFTKMNNEFKENTRYRYEFDNNKYKKLIAWSLNHTSGNMDQISTSMYEYSANKLTITQFDKDNKLFMTAFYTFDNKKNALLNIPSIIPQLSENNYTQVIYKDKDGKETYNNAVSYTYNENNYPLTATSGGNTTTYEYSCK